MISGFKEGGDLTVQGAAGRMGGRVWWGAQGGDFTGDWGFCAWTRWTNGRVGLRGENEWAGGCGRHWAKTALAGVGGAGFPSAMNGRDGQRGRGGKVSGQDARSVWGDVGIRLSFEGGG